MTELVVHRLEVVEVHEEQGAVLRLQLVEFAHPLELRFEPSAVDQTGQRIVVCQVGDRVVDPLPFGDVDRDEEKRHRRHVLACQRAERQVDEPSPPVLTCETPIGPDDGTGILQGGCDVLREIRL